MSVETLPNEVITLVWGATSFTAIPLETFIWPSTLFAIEEVMLQDRILDARTLDTGMVGLVTAKNALVVYSREKKRIVQEIKCEEQSLLYAAQIYPSGRKGIIVAVGTVFNDIQIWYPSKFLTEDASTSVVPIDRRLKGHEGCIFSIRFNAEGTLLASCSDDRTIRVWSIIGGVCLATGFGHLARVWDVRFFPSDLTNDQYLLSTSEDASAFLWHFSLTDGKLAVLEQYHGHGGKHVWSQAISSTGAIAATGGNDGGVSIWDISGYPGRTGKYSDDIHWTTQSPPDMESGDKTKADPIKGYCCVNDDTLLITTKSG
jgi:WD repeat-containing protein 6